MQIMNVHYVEHHYCSKYKKESPSFYIWATVFFELPPSDDYNTHNSSCMRLAYWISQSSFLLMTLGGQIIEFSLSEWNDCDETA